MPFKRVKEGRRVLTGQITEGTYNGQENRIQLFDGKFTTGYRIVSFQITPEDPTAEHNIIGKLSTEPLSTMDKWNWQDVKELAWAKWQSESKVTSHYNNLREDNMAIEDLWISVYNKVVDNALANYEIILEKYTFPAWDGAGILVENLSQAGPS